MKLIIKRNIDGEFEVPTPNGHGKPTDAIYFTDDRDDALGTAQLVWQAVSLALPLDIVIRSGSYQ